MIQTRADGRYVFKKKVARKKTAQKLILIAFVNFYVGDCADPPLLPGGCAEQSIAPPPAHFGSLTIPKQPPKPKHCRQDRPRPRLRFGGDARPN